LGDETVKLLIFLPTIAIEGGTCAPYRIEPLLSQEHVVMATVLIRNEFAISVTSTELLLILKALGCRLRPHELDPAKELGDILTVQKAKVIQQLTKENDKLFASLRVNGLLDTEEKDKPKEDQSPR